MAKHKKGLAPPRDVGEVRGGQVTPEQKKSLSLSDLKLHILEVAGIIFLVITIIKIIVWEISAWVRGH